MSWPAIQQVSCPACRAAVALMVLLMACSTAKAGPTKEEANELYRRGNQQFTRGDYGEALASYRKARMLFSSYKLDFNIARTLDALGRSTEAATFFHQFLARADHQKAPAAMIADARKRLLLLRRKVASVTLQCPRGVQVVHNGRSLGQPHQQRFYLEPGTHYFSIKKQGHDPPVRRVTLVAGEHRRLNLVLRARSTGPATAGDHGGLRPIAPAEPAEGNEVDHRSTHGSPHTGGRPSLLLGLGLGLCVAGLERAHVLSDHMKTTMEASSQHTLEQAPQSSLALNLEFSVRYLAPYHLLGQLGLGMIYNSASSDYAGPVSGTVSNQNMVLELPLLVGGYLVLLDRLHLVAAVGPSLFFAARSYWDAEPGAVSDFEADVGAGFHALIGVDYMISTRLGLGLELRYRHLQTGELRQLESETPLESGAVLGSSATETYDLDFSGLMVAFNLRFVAL